MNEQSSDSHSVLMGYLLWIFGFMGSHRFYYGRNISGVIWFFTFGLFFIGWIVDLLLIPGMAESADVRFKSGPYNYSVAWILLTFLGIFGIHRFYQQKWISGILYLLTGGVFGLGLLYDFFNLNDQLHYLNSTTL